MDLVPLDLAKVQGTLEVRSCLDLNHSLDLYQLYIPLKIFSDMFIFSYHTVIIELLNSALQYNIWLN